MDETKSTERTSLASRVRAGVKLLDEELPGWEQRMNLASFDVWLARSCVLGQLFGHYRQGATALFGPEWDAEPAGYGFDVSYCDEGHETCRRLTRLWSFAIRQRQAVSQ